MNKPWKLYDLSKSEPISRHNNYQSAGIAMQTYCDDNNLIAELHVIRVYEPEKEEVEFVTNRMAIKMMRNLWKKTQTVYITK